MRLFTHHGSLHEKSVSPFSIVARSPQEPDILSRVARLGAAGEILI